MSLLSRWKRFTALVAWIGGAALIGLMAVTVIDIVGRNAGVLYLQGVIEFSNVTVVCLGMLGLAYCFTRNGHIVVDLATMAAPPRLNRALDSLWLVVAAGALGTMAWLMWQEGLALHASGEVSDNLQWSPLVFYLPASAGAGIAALTCAALAVSRIAAGPEDGDDKGETGI